MNAYGNIKINKKEIEYINYNSNKNNNFVNENKNGIKRIINKNGYKENEDRDIKDDDIDKQNNEYKEKVKEFKNVKDYLLKIIE